MKAKLLKKLRKKFVKKYKIYYVRRYTGYRRTEKYYVIYNENNDIITTHKTEESVKIQLVHLVDIDIKNYLRDCGYEKKCKVNIYPW